MMSDRHYILAFYTGNRAVVETALKQMLRLMFISRVVYVGKFEKHLNEMNLRDLNSNIYFSCVKCKDIKFDICAVATD